MADPGPSTSQAQRTTPQQQRQQQEQEARQNGRKRRLSMNRKKGNKKGPKKAPEDAEEKPSLLLESLLTNLRTCPAGKEMQALVSALQPSAGDVEMALNMVKDDLRRVLLFPGNQASIYEFGSIKSGLLLKDSDLDFYIHFAQERNEREQQIKLIHVVSGRMDRDGSFTGMTKILGAKVPLLRAVHVRTNLQCDINFSNARGCYNSKFIYALMQFDPRIHQLALAVKFWAHCAHILTVHKQMNSYCLVMMLIFYLQTRKLPVIPSVEDLQQGIARINYGPWNLGYPVQIKYKTWNVNTVRELLVGFFKYYSEFDFEANLISPFVGRLCSVQELEKKTIRELATYYRAIEREDYPEFIGGPFISIQDPFELNVNVGKVLRTKMLYEQLTLSFRHAYALCLQYQEKPLSELLIALFTDTQRYQKPKAGKTTPTKNGNATATAMPSDAGATVNGTSSDSSAQPSTSSAKPVAPANTTGFWLMCRLTPIEYELFLVKEILLARDPDRKVVITDERIRQLWRECMPDFIVDILRKLYMVKLEPIESEPPITETNDDPVVHRFQMSCERQVFIARKRLNITNEAELKQEIEISKQRWEKNHSLRFNTRVDLTTGAKGEIELRIPKSQPNTGPLRLFIDTCFMVHIRKCVKGYFMVMLAKAKQAQRQGKRGQAASGEADLPPSESTKKEPEPSAPADEVKQEPAEASSAVRESSPESLATANVS
uniref:PAP-associated domain-containing protein n=1 Tax=Anopheles atroparvus TaxID=41427 RepID=A0AAG5D6P7_ANOAO